MQPDELVSLVKDLLLLHPNSSLECIIEYVLSNAVRFEERDSVRKYLNEVFAATEKKKKDSKTNEIDCIVEQFVKVERKGKKKSSDF